MGAGGRKLSRCTFLLNTDADGRCTRVATIVNGASLATGARRPAVVRLLEESVESGSSVGEEVQQTEGVVFELRAVNHRFDCAVVDAVEPPISVAVATPSEHRPDVALDSQNLSHRRRDLHGVLVGG